MRSSSSVFALPVVLFATACGVAFSASPAESGDPVTADAGQSDSGTGDTPEAVAGGGSPVQQNTSGSAGTAGGPSVGGSGGVAASTGGDAAHFGGTPDNGGAGAGGTAGGGTGGVPACLDAQTSDANCGACGYACVGGRHCAAGRCTPAWQPISEAGAPVARTRHAAAALGGKYVVLGGVPSSGGVGMSSAAEYDPATDAWSALASLNSARCSPEAVSTGNAILTFGGLADCGNGTTATPGLESFDPTSQAGGSWSTISVSGEPEHRYDFAATWTGSAMFVYGGGTNTQSAISSGGLFTPSSAAPAWSDASCALGGCERGGGGDPVDARSAFSAFVDGTLVHIWGGGPFGNAPAGLSYDLVGQSWSEWTVPIGTADHLAQRFADDGRRIYFLTATNVVSVYDRKASSWLANDTAVMPSGFCIDAAPAWTGSELVAWSGSCGGAPVSVGGRYQPAAPN